MPPRRTRAPTTGRRGGPTEPHQPQLACWPKALRTIRSWLRPAITLNRSWRAWTDKDPPSDLQPLIDAVTTGRDGFPIIRLSSDGSVSGSGCSRRTRSAVAAIWHFAYLPGLVCPSHLAPQGRPPARCPLLRTLFRRPPTEPGMRLITAPGSPASIPPSPAERKVRCGFRCDSHGRRSGPCGGVMPSALPSQAVEPDSRGGGHSDVECGALRLLFAPCRVRNGRT